MPISTHVLVVDDKVMLHKTSTAGGTIEISTHAEDLTHVQERQNAQHHAKAVKHQENSQYAVEADARKSSSYVAQAATKAAESVQNTGHITTGNADCDAMQQGDDQQKESNTKMTPGEYVHDIAEHIALAD